MAQPALAVGTSVVESVLRLPVPAQSAPPYCPVCFHVAFDKILETFHACTLHECAGCGLQFWDPRRMPDARWHSAVYGRSERLLPLEPGHCFFLADQLAPRCGRLLDVGCGTGNFLLAANLAGYAVSGIDVDTAAARLATYYCPRARVFPLALESFRAHYPRQVFDVVTFFDVLEHQADPATFLAEARACLRPRGFIALSVPNRNRWQTGADALDYPPNHFLRWSPDSLVAVLKAQGFSIMSLREEKVSLHYAAQQINSKLRLGSASSRTPEMPGWLPSEIPQLREENEEHNRPGLSLRARAIQRLSRWKYAACFPLAAAALPFVRYQGLAGPNLYCLARKLD